MIIVFQLGFGNDELEKLYGHSISCGSNALNPTEKSQKTHPLTGIGERVRFLLRLFEQVGSDGSKRTTMRTLTK